MRTLWILTLLIGVSLVSAKADPIGAASFCAGIGCFGNSGGLSFHTSSTTLTLADVTGFSFFSETAPNFYVWDTSDLLSFSATIEANPHVNLHANWQPWLITSLALQTDFVNFYTGAHGWPGAPPNPLSLVISGPALGIAYLVGISVNKMALCNIVQTP